MNRPDDDVSLREEIARELVDVRDRAREAAPTRTTLPAHKDDGPHAVPLDKLQTGAVVASPASPSRDQLNALWDLAPVMERRPGGLTGRLLAPIRSMLQAMLRFTLGPVLERQTQVNSHQVQFDNELLAYLDQRLDTISQHYDEILGLHGKRMEEIDERHLILQQELIRHVHDLVQRIEYVFESAEQNHLYLEGMLREKRDELSKLEKRLDSVVQRGGDTRGRV